jgi:hypothetical protein
MCIIVKNNDMSTNEGGIKIPWFALNCDSIDVLTWEYLFKVCDFKFKYLIMKKIN